MIPEAYVSHRAPRRLRIKIPSKKGNASFFSALLERLSGCPGIEEINVNPQIGSALILYTCETKTLAEFAKKNELFHLKQVSRPHKTLFGNVADTFQGYNKSLKQMTDGELDIPSLVFLSLLVSGVWQIARGNLMMPAWYTAFYYALGIFTRAHVDEFDEGDELLEGFDDADGD
jgi:hypothetical protein